MTHDPKLTTLFALALAVILILTHEHIPFMTTLHWKLYDELVKMEYKFAPRPAGGDDILLVTIGNLTISKMEERWPWSRSVFARALENIKKAGPRAIGFDFVFYGRSSEGEDTLFKKALQDGDGVVLGAAVDEEGVLSTSTTPALRENAISGFVTKLQGSDGVTRESLTYLIGNKKSKEGVLSWEMQLLKVAKGMDSSTLTDEGSLISFRNDKGEKWLVPVDRGTKSFLIHFRRHTSDFKRLSFWYVLRGDFDPAAVKDKIVLIGLASTLFQDLHKTPLGQLPGITLNANAFLTLYSHDFLRPAPKGVEIFVVLIGVILASFFVSRFKIKIALVFIAIEISLFFAMSYFLLAAWSTVWDYSLFPAATALCPILGKQTYIFMVTKNRWT